MFGKLRANPSGGLLTIELALKCVALRALLQLWVQELFVNMRRNFTIRENHLNACKRWVINFNWLLRVYLYDNDLIFVFRSCLRDFVTFVLPNIWSMEKNVLLNNRQHFFCYLNRFCSVNRDLNVWWELKTAFKFWYTIIYIVLNVLMWEFEVK